jgi:hypothetical protein
VIFTHLSSLKRMGKKIVFKIKALVVSVERF